ncbi:hypothetical protein BCR34DRAFT_565294 [Clohesyomyces aquaticus]|uniref:Uncharacterized protein n=1 Tax=Clohesyomyces aquaticus TaxID=1231657 RepID=A0A1Y1ZMB9_9PLEO|nr:hypothetical protein BCR34DRAFT_565294 [Clohesyomyces aquaticus]
MSFNNHKDLRVPIDELMDLIGSTGDSEAQTPPPPAEHQAEDSPAEPQNPLAQVSALPAQAPVAAAQVPALTILPYGHGQAQPPDLGINANPPVLSEADQAKVSDPNAYPAVDDLVSWLMDPPHNFREEFNLPSPVGPHHIIQWKIRLNWSIARTHEVHWVHIPGFGRSVLRHDSKLRVHGLNAGLPQGYYEWLCGIGGPQRWANNPSVYVIPAQKFYTDRKTPSSY